MKNANKRLYLADKGKVFIYKESQNIIGYGIYLGVDDSIDNYDEIDCPQEYKGNKDYDNTIEEKHENINREPRMKKIFNKEYLSGLLKNIMK